MIGVNIFWALVAGFAAGVGVRSLWALSAWFVMFAWLCAVIVLTVVRKRDRWVIAAALLACGLGVLRMDAGILRGDAQLNAHINKSVVITGVVATEPDEREGNTLLTIAVSALASSTKPVHASVLAIAPARTRVAYGDVVRVRGVVKVPEAFAGNNGRVFDYPGYLAAQGIGYQLQYADVTKEEGSRGNRAVAAAIAIKNLFIRGIDRALPEPEAGLASGVMAGDKRGLGTELTDDFRAVSLVHIIVLSGYNITVVIGGLYEACRRLHIPRIVRFGGGIIIALFFALATGFAAASLRASVMALIMITGEWSGRVYRADRALGVAVVGMLVWDPYSLMFDPGFQLSFMATLGLMLLSPAVMPHIERLPVPKSIQDILVATLCAQAAVLPLLLYSSGQLSLVALPANILVLSIMQQTMLLTLFAALAGMIMPMIAAIIGLPAYLLLGYIIAVARYLSHVPFATVQMPPFSAWWLIPIYAIVFGLAALPLFTQKAPEAGLFAESQGRKHKG